MKLKTKVQSASDVATQKIHKAGLLVIDRNLNVYTLERLHPYDSLCTTKPTTSDDKFFWERWQIPRGSSSKKKERLLETALREFTEETSLHYVKNQKYYIYKKNFILEWFDKKQWSYTIYVMYIDCNLLRSNKEHYEFEIQSNTASEFTIKQIERHHNWKRIVRENKILKLNIVSLPTYNEFMIATLKKNNIISNYFTFLQWMYDVAHKIEKIQENPHVQPPDFFIATFV